MFVTSRIRGLTDVFFIVAHQRTRQGSEKARTRTHGSHDTARHAAHAAAARGSGPREGGGGKRQQKAGELSETRWMHH